MSTSTQYVRVHKVATTHAEWSVRRWIAINAAALATAFGLFALFGGIVETLGAEHDSVVRDLSLLAGFIVGGSVFAVLRQRTLLPQVSRTTRVAIAAIIGLSVGVVTGFLVAGPPFDFAFSIFAGGTLAGAVEWRILRRHMRHPGRLGAASVGAWLVAAVAAIAPAVLVGDAIDAAFGSGVTGFVAILLLIGLVGGAVGGAGEARALRSRINPTA